MNNTERFFILKRNEEKGRPMKDTFILRTENKVSIDKMSDEDAGRLLKAIYAHVAGEDVTEDNEPVSVQLLLPLIVGQIDRANERYKEICERRAEAGKKGGRPKKEDEEKTNAFSEKQKKQKVFSESKKNKAKHNEPEPVPDNEPVPDSDPEPENDSVQVRRETALKRSKEIMLPQDLDQDIVRDAIVDFRAMRTKLRKPMTQRAEELMIKDLSKLARGDPILAVKILEQSIKNGWLGVFPLQEDKGKRSMAERMAAL